jgi:HPt (histidine-containing phosphotransfer) domain-containing protein
MQKLPIQFLQHRLILALLSLFASPLWAHETLEFHRGLLNLDNWTGSEVALIHGEWLVLPDQHVLASNVHDIKLAEAFQDPKAEFHMSAALFYQTSVPNLKTAHAAFVLHVHNTRPRSLGLAAAGFKNDFELNVYVPSRQLFYQLDIYGEPHKKEPIKNPFTTPARYLDLDTLGQLGEDFYLIINNRAASVLDSNWMGVVMMTIGTKAQIKDEELTKRFEQFTILGIYAMLTFYSLSIFLLRREDKSSLVVAFLSITLALRYMATERLIIMSPAFYPLTGYSFFLMKIFYAMSAVATVMFVILNFGANFGRKMRIFSVLVVASAWLDAFAFLIWDFVLSNVTSVFFMLGFGLVLIPYFIYLGWKGMQKGGVFLSISLLIFAISMGNDFYQVASAQIDTLWLGHYGMLALALGFTLVNAKVFSNTFETSLELNDTLQIRNQEIMKANEEITFFSKNLENLVQQKTQKITALLDHIPQGILSLEVGGVISRDFSRHLIDIVDDEAVAGRTFKELILDRSNLNADIRDQIWQTLQVVIGEIDINFDANLDKLPSELTLQTRQGPKWLKLTWNVETSDRIVQRMLVTMLDITKEKVLQEKAEAQRHEFEIIRELIEAGDRKIGQYFYSATALLCENEKILDKEAHAIDYSDIQSLFINLHTIKGGARTLGLKELARVFHEVEEYYQDILQKRLVIDKQRLLDDLKKAMVVYEYYLTVNKNTLNRTEAFSKVVVDREFVEAHYQALRGIVSDLDRKVQTLESIGPRLRSQRDAVARLIFDQLPAVFDEYKGKAGKIAREVQKPAPQFDLELDSINVTPDMKVLLDNCMVHILRNALSHGIETPEERLQCGKAEVGTISIRSQVQGEFLNLEIQDDGRGLAIHKLREKGLLQAGTALQDVAEVIFMPGVSTASAMTDISGRGVGMDAVRKFLEQEGGGIEVRLGAPKDASQEFYDFKFLIKIPLKKSSRLPLLTERAV